LYYSFAIEPSATRLSGRGIMTYVERNTDISSLLLSSHIVESRTLLASLYCKTDLHDLN